MVFRREQDQAIKLRLEQLENARAAQVASATPQQDMLVTGSVKTIAQPAYGRRDLMFTAIFSALAGACLTWLTVGETANKTMSPATASMLPAAQDTHLMSVAKVVPQSPVTLVDGEAEATAVLEAWRQAWERRDVNAYLGFYSPIFVPANGQTLAAWRKVRQIKLARPSSIRVGIRELRSERLAADQVQLTFLQDYQSGNYKELGQPKTLLIQLHGKKWQITGEWQGPINR